MVDNSLKTFLLGLDANVATELFALDVRRCLNYLGEITGDITNDDQWGLNFQQVLY